MVAVVPNTQIGVGSPVQYCCDPTSSPNQYTVHAAVVLNIDSNGNANLMVFPDGSYPNMEAQPFLIQNVPPAQNSGNPPYNFWQQIAP